VVAVVALPRFVLEATGSPVLTGVTAFASTVPLRHRAITGGAIVDRLGTRLVLFAMGNTLLWGVRHSQPLDP
jgi:hypothetical protein